MDRSELVVVALPSEDDYVWKLSSEKVPHLTLLYLDGDRIGPEQIDQLTGYVEHASSMLSPFSLEVESRGELGDANADVLFFSKWWIKEIENFRRSLLGNTLIMSAYLSADQYPTWTPHLTLGYPETPAKKDLREYPGTTYVRFDRIALWTGESEGPTFTLKSRDYERVVAMSQSERGRSLKHYGVKGMKWGVVHDPSSGAATASTARARSSDDVKAAEKSKMKIEAHGTHALSNKELQNVLARMELENRYQKATNENRELLDSGYQQAKKYLAYGETIEKARKFAESPTGRVIGKGLKYGYKFAKGAVAVKTGGASTGAEIALKALSNHYSNVGN